MIGRRVRLNGLDFTVIGVATESFTGMDLFSRPAFYVPAAMAPVMISSNHDLLTDRRSRAFSVKGRLKPGVSMQAGSAEAAALAKSLEQSYPATNRAFGAALRTELQARLDNDPATPLIIAMPVSYTHLDVYKRQDPRRTRFPRKCARAPLLHPCRGPDPLRA